MALPIAAAPTYEFVVPSTKEVVKFRPFLVKEEKALLIAQQSDKPQVMFDTLKDIIRGCTFDKLNVENLAMFDIEYIFVQLRSKSVGERSELIFSCKQCNDPKAKMKVEVDLDELEVHFDPEHKTDILLFDDVGIKMKYPGIATVKKMQGKDIDNDVNAIFDIIVSCIDCIYDDNNVYAAKDASKEELEAFINNLTQDQFSKLQQFFQTMPRLEKTFEFDCPVCGFHHTQVVQGIEGFF